MAESIPAIYEDGIILITDEEATLINAQKKELTKIIGIGSSGKTDIARKHDRYLY